MVRISDILKRGNDEEEPRKKKSEETARAKKERVFPRPAEDPAIEAKEESPRPSHVEISRVMMERTKVGRPTIDEIYDELIALIKDILAKGERDEPIEGREIVAKIDKVVDQMAMTDSELITLTTRSTPDNYLYGHSINICLLSMSIGLGLGYNKSKLIDLGVAGILHDIGMVKVMDIIQQSKRLTNKEYETVKQHPLYGVEILEKAKDLTKVVIYVTHEQHERMDGSGYPQGLKDGEISEYARIVGLVDAYEALTHPRPHREKLQPYEAMKKILKDKAQFDSRFLKVLIREIGVYPLGSWVELNTGETGKVVRINKERPLQSTVNVLFDSEGHKLDEPKSVDLTRHPTLYIKKPVDGTELEAKLAEKK